MDIKLYYCEAGKGEPLVMLHGNGESCLYFENQIAYFSRSYRVVALDTRGHGASPRGREPFTIAQFAQDLYEFMVEKGIDSAHILGFSDGANIALCFALRHQDMVKSLILNGANLDPAGVKPQVQLPIELGYRLSGRFAGSSYDARRAHELLGLMVKDPNIAPEELYGLTVPVLVIVGTRDLIKLSHSRLICGSIAGARLALVKGDHFIAANNPADFNREVEIFLSEIKQQP